MNPDYDSTFLFENDFPALQPDAPDPGKLWGSLSSLKKEYFSRPFYQSCGKEGCVVEKSNCKHIIPSSLRSGAGQGCLKDEQKNECPHAGVAPNSLFDYKNGSVSTPSGSSSD